MYTVDPRRECIPILGEGVDPSRAHLDVLREPLLEPVRRLVAGGRGDHRVGHLVGEDGDELGMQAAELGEGDPHPAVEQADDTDVAAVVLQEVADGEEVDLDRPGAARLRDPVQCSRRRRSSSRTQATPWAYLSPVASG